ncbi:MAG TPA: type II toxin-antitoxin system PemK/MazF family toxin [Chloroflexota bacterium]|nr:type II toxin-antitoxin system PemK/MazF family toxin [Chloroflexota bacterium]
MVLIPFPFTNQTASKRRPAVVVSTPSFHNGRPDLILMAVTSQVRTPLRTGEALLADWLAAGLLKPSVAKPELMTVQTSLVLRKLGRLGSGDRRSISEVLDRILGP